MDTAIDVADLVIDRGKREVLHGISARIGRGSVTGLLGPSGSGKTTLIRAIVGVQIVKSGTVTVLGQPAGSPQLRHAIGYLTQSPSVYADLTVRENARYFASLYGLGAAAADEAIDAVGLGDAAGQLVSTLSGGQRSRASLACALVGKPDVLVLDEPTVGQDPVLRDELWQRFRAPCRGRHHVAGLQPRHGRGQPLRPAAADPRGRAHRRRHPGRDQGEHRHRRPGRGVPRHDPSP